MEYINGTTRFEKFKFLTAFGGVLSFNRRENLVFHMDFVIYLKGGNAQGLLQHEVNKK